MTVSVYPLTVALPAGHPIPAGRSVELRGGKKLTIAALQLGVPASSGRKPTNRQKHKGKFTVRWLTFTPGFASGRLVDIASTTDSPFPSTTQTNRSSPTSPTSSTPPTVRYQGRSSSVWAVLSYTAGWTVDPSSRNSEAGVAQ